MNQDNKRDIIVSELATMRKKETIEKNFFKARAYQKVIDQISVIESVKSFDDLNDVSGIGTKIRAKLEEIFATGRLKAAEKARAVSKIKDYDIFLKIHGIGVVKAKELLEAGITSIEELNRNQHLLNDTQRIGLKYYQDIQLRIPRKEIEKHGRKISKLTCDIDPDLEIKLVGSYRRGTEDSGDIDVLVTIKRETNHAQREDVLKKIIQVLKDHEYLLSDLSTGRKKYMGIARVNKHTPARRIDLLMTSREEYPFALLYFTGDFQINIALRKKASELNYVLNEYGLKGCSADIVSEKEIFNLLGFKFLKPKDRYIQNLQEL